MEIATDTYGTCNGCGQSVTEDHECLDEVRNHRPSIGTPVRVTFPAREWHDAETVDAEVVEHYPDGIDVRVIQDADFHVTGDLFTIFDSERSDGRTTLEVVG